MKRLLRSPAVLAAAAWLLGAYLSFALRTTRWRLEGAAHLEPHSRTTPCVAAFWHEVLPLMPELWLLTRRRGARMHMHVLVSRHRDGRFIGDIMRRFHLHLVHGSTSVPGKQRGGMAAQKRLLGLLRQGDHVAITPDGPRGPRRIAAPGVAQLAALAGVPVLPCAAQTTRRHVLPSWDRMVLPLPFGRGVIVVGAAIHVPEDDWASALPVIEAALTHAAERADALCGLRRAAHRPQRA